MRDPAKKELSEYFIRTSFFLIVAFTIVVSLWGLQLLAVPMVMALLIFYAFNGTINNLESLGVPRILSIAILMLVISIPIYLFINSVAPPIVSTLNPLLKNWKQDLDEAKFKYLTVTVNLQFNEFPSSWNETIRPDELIKRIAELMHEQVKGFVSYVPTLIGYMIITPLFAFLFLLNGNGMYKNLIALIPNRYFEMALMVTYKINEQLTNYLKSLMIQSAIICVVSGLGFYIIGLPYFYIFGLFLGVANSVPYLGPIMGAIPPLFFALVIGGTGATELMTSILIVVLIAQIIDNFFIQPIVISGSVSLHPIVVVGAVTVGGAALGLVGMLIAVPMAAILKVTIQTLYSSMKDHNLL
ncbi:AI-2E family transporter [Leptospira kmetyi]|uniref:AI-2E family transporter n=1 Tax=Leptospira kmetyi TaxID=408139 RepID=A0A2M9XLJ6_9LEPT|nr:AI-2E family transporter [Leptospira kmetyi]AYV55119.1 AI-2E family transporter [Leptospira kmetyi]EQA52122.1 PF01594 domain protein [Leptospira kmetyi serovar Malaysia str. Bejo-Iso9]PJZ30280.1 AI-2E family transporter [Leptospira kmetyi]PJZ40056.1 AI-2E family transporter [Leptospira kmetyi]TGK19472.1 AI-2E family transporter [Leptospira kmetyi]